MPVTQLKFTLPKNQQQNRLKWNSIFPICWWEMGPMGPMAIHISCNGPKAMAVFVCQSAIIQRGHSVSLNNINWLCVV